MHRTIRAVGGTAWLVIPMFLCATALGFAQSKTERERKPTEQVSPAPNAATENIAAPVKKEDPVFKGLKYRPIGPFRGGRTLRGLPPPSLRKETVSLVAGRAALAHSGKEPRSGADAGTDRGSDRMSPASDHEQALDLPLAP
jgi:hypothetical protein